MKFNNVKSLNFQKGITLFLAVVIMDIFLTTGLALNVMLMTQLKMRGGVSNSLTAFLAADTGLEDELFSYSIQDPKLEPPYSYTKNFGLSSSYTVIVKPNNDITAEPKCLNNSDGSSCIFSFGTFSQSQRRVSMRR